ncbi:hypothetical protein MJO52_11915 [Microbulbifer variabilis]|uniref:Toprim domain-containing protein n=1 Tax=Microbulbifer variabilis TaxID=266805 RepID=A0ABY4V699_9GAMM|nr:hypothetical protein [Microbulbifer variabilis]USD19789.1 hypothetical protein MJO52_11915 [Microbulbifer variabilis]
MDYSAINRDVLEALENDHSLKLVRNGTGDKEVLRGVCPKCDKKTLWIKVNKPITLRCDREDKCQYQERVRDRYPDIFENFSKRYPSTNEDPKATARAYLSIKRGFPSADIEDWFEQGFYKLPDGTWAETVRFYLYDSKENYWERIIDNAHVKTAGRKAHFKSGGSTTDKHWAPPGQVIKPMDKVFIVEGIFHCIAMHLAGYKVVSAFSCTGLPRELIEKNIGQGIIWHLAYDDEPGARKHLAKYRKELQEKGETVEVALTGSKKDWDDLYREKKLNDKTIEQCLWRGRVFVAESPAEKSTMLYAWQKRHYLVFDHKSCLYSAKVNADVLAKNLDGEEFDHNQHSREFLSATSIESISNFVPEFLYALVDDILDERRYVFRVSYTNGNPQGLVELEGGHIDTPSSFHKAMLNNSLGGTFDGSAKDLKILRDRWLNRRITVVKSIPYIGYEPQSGVYVYGDFGYHKGRNLKLNKEGYLEAAGVGIRTSFRGFRLHRGEHKPGWFNNFLTVFHWQGLATLAFWLGSLFVQQIRSRDKSFPFLEVTGEPGAGKSTLLEFCWKLVGRDNHEGMDPAKGSPAGRRRAFAQVSNLPIVLIESDRGDEGGDAKHKQFQFDELKPLFDGRGLGTLGVAKRGNDTEEAMFQGALVIAQNARVEASEAIIQRIVHCHCTREHHSRESEQLARWFNQVTCEEVAGFLPAALGKEREILTTYEKAYAHYRERFYDKGGIKANLGRLIQNHAQIMACAVALKHVIPQIQDDILRGLETYLYQRALDRQGRISKDHPLVERFWEMYDYLNLQHDPKAHSEDVFIEILNHSINKQHEIAINFAHFQDVAKKHGQEFLEFARLKKLLVNSLQYPFVEMRKVKSPTLNKTMHCWIFKKPRNV